MNRRGDLVELPKGQIVPLISPLALPPSTLGPSADAPNEKQGLDLLLRTHAGSILLSLIFIVLLHADLHKGLRRRG